MAGQRNWIVVFVGGVVALAVGIGSLLTSSGIPAFWIASGATAIVASLIYRLRSRSHAAP